jgi:23S rRNA (cytosine1962-C5)-methyltransferase
MKPVSLTVSPQTARMLELGHPWVIADRFTRQWPKGRPGDLVRLVDADGRLLAMALRDPRDRVVARVLAFEAMQLDQAWLSRQVQKALDLRARHADLTDTTAWRLINGEGDGLPGLTVDRYGDHLMLQLFSRAWQPHLPLVVGVLQKLPDVQGIYEKFRPRQTRELAGASKKYSRLLAGRPAPGRLTVRENGLSFLVDLEEGLNTGLFFDQRANRRDLMRRAPSARVLNLFAYTGAFSVAAAAAGAARVTSVDASAAYLDWARDNFSANRLNPKRHEFLVGDCLAVLRQLRREKRRFDIVLMDPPSFSTVGKSRFTTSGGTSDLVAAALPLLEEGGLLITSSNHQKVDLADYLKELRRGALAARARLRVIASAGQAEDFPYPVTFPEGRYLKYLISVKD